MRSFKFVFGQKNGLYKIVNTFTNVLWHLYKIYKYIYKCLMTWFVDEKRNLILG